MKLGPGAVVLPKEVRKLHLEFAKKINKGHAGARKFWRHALPRLKYHNPAIPMSVTRTTDQAGPATLTLSFGQPSNSSSSLTRTRNTVVSPSTVPSVQVHSNIDRTEVIDVKDIHDSEILDKLMSLTNATPVNPTLEEQERLQQLQEEKSKSMLDAMVNMKYQEQKRQEKAVLDQIKGAAVMT